MQKLTLIAALATLAAGAPARAAPAAPSTTTLGEKRDAAPDASLAGSLGAPGPATERRDAPAIAFERFRYGVEGQVSGKRREEMADLEKLVALGGAPGELPGWLFRLAELHWEESQYLFFEANRRDDALSRLGAGATAEAARLRDEKRRLEERSRAEQARAIDRYREIVRGFPAWPRLDEVVFFLGENLWKQDRRADALEAYRALLKRWPQSRFAPDAWMAVGEHWFDAADRKDRAVNLARALESYRRAAGFTGSSVHAYALYKQGWVHYNLAQWDRALALFERVAQAAAPTGAGADKRLALAREARKDYVRTYVHQGVPGDAPEVFRRVGGEHAREMLKGLAGLYYDSGKDREAIVVYNRLIQAEPSQPDAPLFQSRIVTAAGRLGRKELAARQAHVFVEMLPRIEAAAPATAQGREALEAARKEAENTLRTLAVQYHNEWRKTRDPATAGIAESLYRDHLQLFASSPQSHDLRFFHAELLFALRRWQEAGDEYGRVVEVAARAPPEPAGRRPRYLVESLEGAVHAYAELVKGEGSERKAGPAGPARALAPRQKQLVDACERYLALAPRGDKAVEIAYQAAQAWYRHDAFPEAVRLFARIAADHPRHELARYAANLALDALNLQGDHRGMNALARELARNAELVRAHPAIQEDLARVVEQSAFKMVEELQRSGKPAEAADAWVAFAKDWPASRLAPTALHNAAVELGRAKQLERALAAREELLQRYPRHPLVPEALAGAAADHAAAADFERAAVLWERYHAEWRRDAEARRAPGRRAKRGAPGAEPSERPAWREAVARDAIHDAGLLREGLGQYRKAEADRLAFLESWPKAPEAARVFLSIADLHAKQGHPSLEVKHLRVYQRRYVREPDEWLGVQHRIARALERAGDARGAKRAWAEAVAYWKPRRAKVGERGLAPVAQGMLLAIEEDAAAYDRVAFDGGPRQLKARLAEKTRRLERLHRAYTEVVALKQPEPAVCALWRIGVAYERFGAALRGAPLPPEIRRAPALEAEYRKQLEGIAAEPERKGLEGVELAVTKARELGVTNACAREALAAAARAKPSSYGPPFELLPEARAGAVQATGAGGAAGLDLEAELDAGAEAEAAQGEAPAAGSPEPGAMLRLARAELEAGRPEVAWQRVRSALLRDPDSADAYGVLMRAALARGKADLAHLVALRAEKARAATPEVVYLRGRAYEAQRQELLARAEWARAAKGGDAEARRALLGLEFAHRYWPGVAEHARALLAQAPDDVQALVALAVADRHLGRPDAALAGLARAEAKAGGPLPEVHLARALLLARARGDCAAAAAELDRFAGLAGPDEAARSGAARLLRECAESAPSAGRTAALRPVAAGDGERAQPSPAGPAPASPAAPDTPAR